jgi:hypothetical protein
MKRIFTGLFLLVLLFAPLYGQDAGSGSLSTQISSLPEIKVTFTHSWVTPFLQFDNFLMSGNNIRTALSVDLSPVSTNIGAELTITPLALLQLKIGAKGGTGWNIELFGSHINGVGLNSVTAPTTSGYGVGQGWGFNYSEWAAAVLQFDVGAVIPGDWNHIQMQTTQKITYAGYSGVKYVDNDSWYFEASSGEARNGFSYHGDYVLAYALPLSISEVAFIDTIAFMAESDMHLYDWNTAWGGDEMTWTLSGILNFTWFEGFNTAVIVQFNQGKDFSYKSGGLIPRDQVKNTYYRNRVFEDLYFKFFRVAVQIGWKLY